MKKLAILLICVIAMGSLNGCMFLLAGAMLSEDETSTENVSIDNVETTITDNSEVEPTDNEPTNEIAEIGSVFTTGDLNFTITDMSLNYTDYEDEYGWYTPDEGMKYVMVSFKFENVSDEDKYVSIYDFDCYADGSLCEQNYFVDDGDFINANISPNRNVSYMVCFDVPTDATEIELEYNVNIWTEEKILVKLQ